MNPSGPPNARIMIVGEAPGEMEVFKGMPFVGPSGMELDRMLHEAGILRTQCFVTNVCQERPPGNDMGEWLVDLKNPPKADNPKYKNKSWVPWKGKWAHPAVARGFEALEKHIALVKPNLVIALGNTALFALTGEWGIKSWRGSQLVGRVAGHEFKVIPAYHPSAVLRDWSIRSITVHDLRRAAREAVLPLPYNVPNFPRKIRPTFGQVCSFFASMRERLARGPTIVSGDIETRAGHIACMGFYVKGMPTICIPWMCVERAEGYWSEAEEVYIWQEMHELLSHPNLRIVGQNWAYDSQYLNRFFLVRVPVHWDTMVTQHCMFPGMPKGLDYLASLYCDYYKYWKDDIKNWDPKMFQQEDKYWNYNCEDCERTYEIYEAQLPLIENNPRLKSIWDFQTNRLSPLLFKAMIRGIKADIVNKARLSMELDREIKMRNAWVENVCGHPVNVGSPKQMATLFYTDLAQRPVFSRKGNKGITTDDNALQLIAKRTPVLRELCRKFQELRSIRVFKSTFVEARLDRDERIRCSFNIGGTVTFRLSSSENAFGSGLNLQNVPQGNDDPDPGELELPNIRKLFVPDNGLVIFDIDLKNADFYTVVWEADDELFRIALEAGVDMHLLNAGTLFPAASECTLERLKDPDFVKYAKHKYAKSRGFAKIWCHGTNYGGGDRTMATNAGITVRENEKYREKWFGEHPGIKAWHRRVEAQINSLRYVENKFGYRWNIFDRTDAILPEALAWVPQSTTGCVINRAWDQIDRAFSGEGCEILIQVHDSLVGQYPREKQDWFLQKIPEAAKVVVPYDRPLIIPVGMKTSELSWGHCG